MVCSLGQHAIYIYICREKQYIYLNLAFHLILLIFICSHERNLLHENTTATADLEPALSIPQRSRKARLSRERDDSSSRVTAQSYLSLNSEKPVHKRKSEEMDNAMDAWDEGDEERTRSEVKGKKMAGAEALSSTGHRQPPGRTTSSQKCLRTSIDIGNMKTSMAGARTSSTSIQQMHAANESAAAHDYDVTASAVRQGSSSSAAAPLPEPTSTLMLETSRNAVSMHGGVGEEVEEEEEEEHGGDDSLLEQELVSTCTAKIFSLLLFYKSCFCF